MKVGETPVAFLFANGTFMDGPPFGGAKVPKEHGMAAVVLGTKPGYIRENDRAQNGGGCRESGLQKDDRKRPEIGHSKGSHVSFLRRCWPGLVFPAFAVQAGTVTTRDGQGYTGLVKFVDDEHLSVGPVKGPSKGSR